MRFFFGILLLLSACHKHRDIERTSAIIFPKEFIAKAFDFPVGKPNAEGYYNAQKYGENNHLGEDWNSVNGGNSDLGDPIFCIANGYVKEAKDIGRGWGKIIRIIHQLPDGKKLESIYAHCDEMSVEPKEWVRRGQKIGTIGTADGKYTAHLHFEIREDISMGIGQGYAKNKEGYLHPTEFIDANRNIE